MMDHIIPKYVTLVIMMDRIIPKYVTLVTIYSKRKKTKRKNKHTHTHAQTILGTHLFARKNKQQKRLRQDQMAGKT
jgi:hypothetical protein